MYSSSPGFLVPLTIRALVLRRRWVTGRARCVSRGFWDNCLSCCSTRRLPSASRWWSARLRISSSSHGSQELQVDASKSSYLNNIIDGLSFSCVMPHMKVFWCGAPYNGVFESNPCGNSMVKSTVEWCLCSCIYLDKVWERWLKRNQY